MRTLCRSRVVKCGEDYGNSSRVQGGYIICIPYDHRVDGDQSCVNHKQECMLGD